MTHQIRTRHYCAGLVIKDGIVIRAAPVMHWMKGMTEDEVNSWVANNSHKVSMVKIQSEEQMRESQKLARRIFAGGNTIKFDRKKT